MTAKEYGLKSESELLKQAARNSNQEKKRRNEVGSGAAMEMTRMRGQLVASSGADTFLKVTQLVVGFKLLVFTLNLEGA